MQNYQWKYRRVTEWEAVWREEDMENNSKSKCRIIEHRQDKLFTHISIDNCAERTSSTSRCENTLIEALANHCLMSSTQLQSELTQLTTTCDLMVSLHFEKHRHHHHRYSFVKHFNAFLSYWCDSSTFIFYCSTPLLSPSLHRRLVICEINEMK